MRIRTSSCTVTSSPSNILVSADGTPKLLDFGIAKLLSADGDQELKTLTGDGPALTPEFAAPEQVRGGPIVMATDVYSVGVLLYLLLTGRRPYELVGRSSAEIEHIVCETTPLRPSVAVDSNATPATDRHGDAAARGATPARLRRQLRGDLDTIVMKALRKESDRRYPTASALEDDLRRFLDGHPVAARPDSVAYRMRKFAGRHRSGVAVAVVLLAALSGSVIRERTLRGRAEAEARKARAVEEYLVSVFDVADPFAPPGKRGDDVTARALLDRGAARIGASLSAQPDVQAELRSVLGTVYVNLGLFDAAEPLLRRALDQQRALYGPRHPAVAAAMDRLGDLLVRRSRFDDAEALLREALAQRRSFLGNAHPDTAASMDHLATLFQERTDYNAAEPLFREAIAVRETVYGRDHEDVATSLNNLSLLLFMRGQYEETERLYREALAIYVRRLGEDHPLTSGTAQNLAQFLEGLGHYAEAESLYRRALAAKRKTLGNAHPSVTVNLNNLANLLARYRGKIVEAESLAREALALDRQMFHEPHAYVAESLRRLGVVLLLKGDVDAAEQHFRQALAMNRELFGAEHFRIALNLNQIGLTLYARGDLAGAIGRFRESLGQYQQLVGEQHVNYASVTINLAKALREQGHTKDAELLFRGALKRFDPPTPGQREQFSAALVGLGLSVTDQGRQAEAIPLVERALAMRLERFGRDDWRTGEAQLALALALTASGELARGKLALREASSQIEPQRRAQPRLAMQLDRALAQAERSLHAAARP
jgi:tetratricopeptide (TPR) repeat protein